MAYGLWTKIQVVVVKRRNVLYGDFLKNVKKIVKYKIVLWSLVIALLTGNGEIDVVVDNLLVCKEERKEFPIFPGVFM